MTYYIVPFNRFEVRITEEVAKACYHQGDCGDDVDEAYQCSDALADFHRVDPGDLRAELREYGWDEDELADHEQNVKRLIWLAAGNVADGQAEKVEEMG